jgi:hypothetical protein
LTTSWTETAGQICSEALRILGVIAPDETPSSVDMNTALNALNIVLQELPLRGYVWPALTAEASLAWASGNTVTLPADYYKNAALWSSVSGARVPLEQMTHPYWMTLRDTAPVGTTTKFYIDPVGTCYLYPEPDVDPVLTIQYQRLIADTAQFSAADVPKILIGALHYGVANELLITYGRMDIAPQVEGRWAQKRELAFQSLINEAPITFMVSE